MRSFLALAVAGAVALPVTAQPVSPGWMGDDDIRAAFRDVTIDGNYGDGAKFTESYNRDGRLAYSDGARRMTGRWSVVNSAFCTLYDGSSSGGCFKVTRHSANCYEFYFLAASETDAARSEAQAPHWTARAWDTRRAATCDEKPSV